MKTKWSAKIIFFAPEWAAPSFGAKNEIFALLGVRESHNEKIPAVLFLMNFVVTEVLVLDELGYLPIDKTGADLLFRIISRRYERGAMIVTTNRAFKDWPEIFNNDSTLTSAVLDRLLHHSEVVVIEGK